MEYAPESDVSARAWVVRLVESRRSTTAPGMRPAPTAEDTVPWMTWARRPHGAIADANATSADVTTERHRFSTIAPLRLQQVRACLASPQVASTSPIGSTPSERRTA